MLVFSRGSRSLCSFKYLQLYSSVLNHLRRFSSCLSLLPSLLFCCYPVWTQMTLPNHQWEEKKAQPVLCLQARLCSPLSPGQDGGQLHRILESVAKENKYTWTWFDLLGNRFWSIDYIYIIQIINHGRISSKFLWIQTFDNKVSGY